MTEVLNSIKITRSNTAKRYGVSKRTLARWEADPHLGFPRPMIINGRRYDDVAALNAWDARCAAQFIQSVK